MQQHYAQQFKEIKSETSIARAAEVAVCSSEPRIADVIRTGNKKLVEIHIAEAIANYVMLVHPNRGITPEQIVLMSETFASHPDVRHLSIGELKTFLDFAFKTQKLGGGKTYAGFGYDTLLEWFSDYYNQRMNSIIAFRERQHSVHKGNRRSEDDTAFKKFAHEYNVKRYKDENTDKQSD